MHGYPMRYHAAWLHLGDEQNGSKELFRYTFSAEHRGFDVELQQRPLLAVAGIATSWRENSKT
jgi:hypothetical protein